MMSPAATAEPTEIAVDLLRGFKTMSLIRIMEEQLVDYYLKNKVMSFVHFSVGQEAISSGVCHALGPNDVIFGTHRSHAHFLAKGGDPMKMVSELLGRKTGCCNGFGGSMHMIDKSVNFNGSTPILGSVVPIATGSALACKLAKKPGVTAVFFGDGASEEGVVYESLNFAALFKLPIVFIIENNLYSVMTKLHERRSLSHNQEKVAKGLGLEYHKVDGNNYAEVFRRTKTAVAHAEEGKPTLLECMTYRHMAHSAPLFDDKICYREIDVPEERLRKDPIKQVRAQLLANGVTEEDLKAIEAATFESCRQVIEKASQAPFPDPAELTDHVYAD